MKKKCNLSIIALILAGYAFIFQNKDIVSLSLNQIAPSVKTGAEIHKIYCGPCQIDLSDLHVLSEDCRNNHGGIEELAFIDNCGKSRDSCEWGCQTSILCTDGTLKTINGDCGEPYREI